MIGCMVAAGISFRRQGNALAMSHQTLHSLHTGRTSGTVCHRTQSDDPALVDWIVELKAIHPSWGIRRVRAFIRKHTGLTIGRKRTARIMRERGLLCRRIPKWVNRTVIQRLTATRMNHLWTTDMTSFMLYSEMKTLPHISRKSETENP